MLRFVFVLLLAAHLAAQSLPLAPPETLGFSPERLRRLDALMDQYTRDGKIAGAVTFIARHGKVAHFQTHGHRDLESKQPMTRDTLFRIASMSKAITSVAVMMLLEEGRVRLNDPVSRFIPSFEKTTVLTASGGSEPAKRPITIRHLLTHTSGVSYGANAAAKRYQDAGVHMWYFADKAEPLAAVIDRLAKLPFDAHPGERYIYGFNTDILGRVVEVASGMALDKFFETRIFQPLQMHDTHFFLPREKASRLATVYAATENGRIVRAPDKGREAQGEYVEGPRQCFSGGAGLVASTDNYARFLEMLRNGGTLDGVRILSPASVASMTSNHVGDMFQDGEMGFGLGFSVVEHIGKAGRLASVGEYGWGGAYFTQYWVAPKEGVVALFMTQLLPARGLDLQDKFRALVYQSIVGPGL
ncbi:MAG: beta-lactamase family protein [Bryobacterales bacterium]|nr:beta-lactamase family protein [Bryobacterales bacterium]